MSIVVSAHWDLETFEVEIFRDGSLEFPDLDLRYEQAMAEFYPPGSGAVKLYSLWVESPIDVIIGYLELPELTATKLTADYVEHILHFFEAEYPEDKRPRDWVVSLRKFNALKFVGRADNKAFRDVEKAGEEAWSMAAENGFVWAEATAMSWFTGYDINPTAIHQHGFQQAHDSEITWQIRRFVDCMEAIGRGEDWPDIKETP